MAAPDESECSYNDEPMCPYCGHRHSDFYEVSGNSEGDGEHRCDNCNRKFRWSCVVEVTYSTDPVVGPHQLDDFWQQRDAVQSERDP